MEVPGVSGRVVARIETPAGAIVIGGRGPNTYNLDSMASVALVIDLERRKHLLRRHCVDQSAGLGEYQPRRPQYLPVVQARRAGRVDPRHLNDRQRRGWQPLRRSRYVPGLDHRGRRHYRRVRRRQRLSRAACRVQGQAIGGLAIIIGHGSGNNYHAGMWAQGTRRPAGIRHYRRHRRPRSLLSWRSLDVNSYKPETPGYEGFGQGLGARHPPGGVRRHRHVT